MFRMGQLGIRQQRFVDEYMIDLNGTQAAIRAGYSVKTANEQSSRLLANVNVQAAIARLQAERSKRTGVSADRIVLELAKLGFVNITDVADFDDATVRDDANRNDTAAIQSVKVKRIPTEDGDIVERELKLHDKVKSLDLLGRHLGIWNDKLKINGGVPVVIRDDLPEDDE